MTRKDKLGFSLRLLITLGLVAFVAGRLELGRFVDRLQALSWAWLAIAGSVVLLAVVISAWKWGRILEARAHPVPFSELLRLYFVGLFFNNVLPTTVGGDAVRAWETTRATGEVPEAIGSVVSERLIAGVALGFTALVGLPFVAGDADLWRTVLVFLLIDLALVGVFIVPRVAEAIVAKTLPTRFAVVRSTVANTVAVVRATLQTPRLFLLVFVLSVVFQIGVAAVNAAIFKALGVEVSLAHCIVFTPMIFTVAMLPVSISGFGVREAAYWFFFAQVGVSQTDAVACSLLFFIIVGLCSLPGAPLFVLGKRRSQAPCAA